MSNVIPLRQGHQDENWTRAADALRGLSHAGRLLRADLAIISASMRTLDKAMPRLDAEDRENLLAVMGDADAAFAVALAGLATRLADAELDLEQLLGGAAS
ncbi:MAG: hypothetical protein R3E46_04195 [Sedimenticolaceae bacterium]